MKWLQAPLFNRDRGEWDGPGRRLHAYVLERLAGYLPDDASKEPEEVRCVSC